MRQNGMSSLKNTVIVFHELIPSHIPFYFYFSAPSRLGVCYISSAVHSDTNLCVMKEYVYSKS